jgi:hypothetical protein
MGDMIETYKIINENFPSIYLIGFWMHLLMVRLWLGLVTCSKLLLLYKTLVRTHLDYASSVWAPYKKKYIDYFFYWICYRSLTIILGKN